MNKNYTFHCNTTLSEKSKNDPILASTLNQKLKRDYSNSTNKGDNVTFGAERVKTQSFLPQYYGYSL